MAGSVGDSMMLVEGGGGEGDMTQLARSVAAKMAQKKREEDAPFRTKAQR